MQEKIPPFTEASFTLSADQRAAITQGLSARQAFLVNRWQDMLETQNRGDYVGMDDYFDTERMIYANPNRADLASYREWKKSPMALYETFPPSLYRTLAAWGRGEDEICVYCHHHGRHTGGPYMGHPPSGRELNVIWYSAVRFEGDRIIHIHSIADVLSMFIDLGVVDAPQPLNPYR